MGIRNHQELGELSVINTETKENQKKIHCGRVVAPPPQVWLTGVVLPGPLPLQKKKTFFPLELALQSSMSMKTSSMARTIPDGFC